MQYRCAAAVSLFCILCVTGRANESVLHSVEVAGTSRTFNLQTTAGQPLNPALVEKDVHKLWATGSFDDIQVEETHTPQGTDLVFRVTEKTRYHLHEVRYEPSHGPHASPLEKGALIDPQRAQQAAAQARQQLVADGYRDARVEAKLVPAGGDKADLLLQLNPGRRYIVQDVHFLGDLAIDPDELTHWLRSTRVRQVFPLLWTNHPPFSDDAIANDLERLRSLYISHGYLQPDLRLDGVDYDGGKAMVRLAVRTGPRYGVRTAQLVADGKATRIETTADGTFPSAAFCRCLLDERRKAERAGKMDFTTQLQLREVAPPDPGPRPDAFAPAKWVDLDASLDTGQPYTVGRIEFQGSRRYSDLTVRRALVLDEGAVFDWSRLERSIARVNAMGLFEPLREGSVRIKRYDSAHRADVTFMLKDRPRGRWFLSGPVGPASVAGPLQAVIQSHLPRWGSGILEASTYLATVSYVGFASPVLKLLPSGALSKSFFPFFALERPLLPGQWWASGFALSPEYGWQGALLSYGTRHVYGTARNALLGGYQVPSLAVPVERIAEGGGSSSAGFLLCEPPKSNWSKARFAARLALDFAFSGSPF